MRGPGCGRKKGKVFFAIAYRLALTRPSIFRYKHLRKKEILGEGNKMGVQNGAFGQQVEEQARKSSIEINHLTKDLVASFTSRFERQNIRVETDLPEVKADVIPEVIHRAVANLIENAIDAMPKGGELLVTLVDCRHQWELEVADTSSIPKVGEAPTSRDRELKLKSEPIRLQAECSPERLEIANSAAMVHGGQVQTWECPQGGTANVLVIPRFAQRKAA